MTFHEITPELQQTIATYMDDDIRERVHNLLAPCRFADFLNIYCDLDPSFTILLRGEFDVTGFDCYDTSYISLVCDLAGLKEEFDRCEPEELETLLELAYERLSLKSEQDHAYQVYTYTTGRETLDYVFKSDQEARDRVEFLKCRGVEAGYRLIY